LLACLSLAAIVVVLPEGFGFFNPAIAQVQTPLAIRSDPFQGHSSESVRLSATEALPLEKLDAQSRAKVHAVLANVTIFRRMPVRVIDCDPDLYLFLVRHPDVVVNIWRALKISQLQLQQTGPETFRLKENTGITADLQYLYRSHDTQLIYAEGVYEGAILPRPVKGSGLFLLKSGYIQETDGKYYISSRLDAFLSIEPGAVELVAKVLHPLVGKTADNNFTQTVGFVGSLSRTAEINARSIQRLAFQLDAVQPEVREEFSILTGAIAQKSSAALWRELSEPKHVARKESGAVKR
jgi:hypothetical protein